MSYRDDLDAAHARIHALEVELARARARAPTPVPAPSPHRGRIAWRLLVLAILGFCYAVCHTMREAQRADERARISTGTRR